MFLVMGEASGTFPGLKTSDRITTAMTRVGNPTSICQLQKTAGKKAAPILERTPLAPTCGVALSMSKLTVDTVPKFHRVRGNLGTHGTVRGSTFCAVDSSIRVSYVSLLLALNRVIH